MKFDPFPRGTCCSCRQVGDAFGEDPKSSESQGLCMSNEKGSWRTVTDDDVLDLKMT